MPQITIGWTSAIGPLCIAAPWKANPKIPSSWPTSHTGWVTRCRIRPTAPRADSGAWPAAMCCTDVDRAVVSALARAKTTARRVTPTL